MAKEYQIVERGFRWGEENIEEYIQYLESQFSYWRNTYGGPSPEQTTEVRHQQYQALRARFVKAAPAIRARLEQLIQEREGMEKNPTQPNAKEKLLAQLAELERLAREAGFEL